MIKHKRTLVRGMLFVAAVAGLLVTKPPAAHSGSDKWTICHYPPGNRDNAQVITVGAAAVPFHVALHGDCVQDTCPCGPGPG